MNTVSSTRPKRLTQKQKNAKFWKMSKQRRRVAIAKDVIKQIELEKFIPRHNVYLELGDNEICTKDSVELQSKLKGKQCEVCALGAVFCSMVSLGDNLKVGDAKNLAGFGDWETVYIDNLFSHDSVKRCFDEHQIDLIEFAFDHVANYGTVSDAEAEACDKFTRHVENQILDAEWNRNPEFIMIAIMKNIIRNKGEFVPSDLPKKD